MGFYLADVEARYKSVMPALTWKPKIFVHWRTGADCFNYDVMDKDTYEEAARNKKLFFDTDMSNIGVDLDVFVYKDDEAREWCNKNLNVEDVVTMPEELQEIIQVVRATPFPEYEEPTKWDIESYKLVGKVFPYPMKDPLKEPKPFLPDANTRGSKPQVPGAGSSRLPVMEPMALPTSEAEP